MIDPEKLNLKKNTDLPPKYSYSDDHEVEEEPNFKFSWSLSLDLLSKKIDGWKFNFKWRI